MLDELNYLLPVSHKSFCSLIAHLEVKVHIAKKTCDHIAIIVNKRVSRCRLADLLEFCTFIKDNQCNLLLVAKQKV